jgi:hypothetical protein
MFSVFINGNKLLMGVVYKLFYVHFATTLHCIVVTLETQNLTMTCNKA